MKKILLVLLFFTMQNLFAQNVGIGTNSPKSTLDVQGSISTKITTYSANATLTGSDALVFCNSISPMAITLPSAIGVSGRTYTIKNINTGSVTILTSAGQTIDGINKFILPSKYHSLQIVSNNAEWIVVFQQVNVFTIGQQYGGGTIFYIDKSLQHGLIVANADQSTGVTWGCYGAVIGTSAQGVAIGTGQSNTKAIIATCSLPGIAAKLCDDLVLNGYDDWFLPSRDELGVLAGLKIQLGLASNIYWSSSEIDGLTAYSEIFDLEQSAGTNRSGSYYVRAIRSF